MTASRWADLITGWTYAMAAVGAILLAVLIRRLTNPAWRREYLGAADDAPTEGSTVPIGEPQPAPGTGRVPGAGPTPPRARLAARHEEPQTRVTAAPTPLAGAVGDPDRDVDTLSRTPVSASPTKRPAAVAVSPDSTAAAGLPPGPSCVAADGPARGAA
jgi:hypothetical protein